MVRTFKPHIMKQNRNKLGYCTIQLCKNGSYKKWMVHRLVAFAFPEICGEWFEGAVVNHKDEDKTNNHAENLEWVTQQYNLTYNNGHKRRLETRNNNKSYHYERMVGQYSLDGTLIKVYKNSTETGYCRECIRDCCLGKQQTSHGYIWKYLN